MNKIYRVRLQATKPNWIFTGIFRTKDNKSVIAIIPRENLTRMLNLAKVFKIDIKKFKKLVNTKLKKYSDIGIAIEELSKHFNIGLY